MLAQRADLPDDSREIIDAREKSRIAIVDSSALLLEMLRRNPRDLARLDVESLEKFVEERLDSFGFAVKRIGRVYEPDGGVDIIAVAPGSLSYMIVVQVKSHSGSGRRTGASSVRELLGTAQGSVGKLPGIPMKFGLIVTNTEFTKNALEVMEQGWNSELLRRAAYPELCRWLAGHFLIRPTPDAVVPPVIDIPGGPQCDLSNVVQIDGYGRVIKRCTRNSD